LDAHPTPSGIRAFLRSHRQEARFLGIFLAVLIFGFSALAWNPVNDSLVEPFTGWVARASGALLGWMGQDVAMRGTVIESPKFSVNIRNGCNGVEALLIFLAAVLAFPASWREKLTGLALGAVAIQAVNLVRVVALFLTGAYYPKLFDTSHTVVWQTIVILCSVLFWIFWASRLSPVAKARPEKG
jgi:exosortase H (IPTLxxWG-CTERM-specific)